MLFLIAGKEIGDVRINVTLRRACFILCVCSPRYPTYNARTPYFHLWPVLPYFSTLSQNRTIFGKE